MYQRQEQKTIYTLNLDKAYPKEITDMTYPLLKTYAQKIGADFYEITERKFPQWTATYEKCQVYELGQLHKNDWNIFVDCDALIHPDTPDVTAHMSKEFTAHNGADLNTIRWRMNNVFRRDGRKIGSASWFCVASDWTIDLFHPMVDMTPDETYFQIIPVYNELKAGVTPSRLIEDYVFSYNIAKYGLKFDTIHDIFERNKIGGFNFLWHIYAVPYQEKVVNMRNVLKAWGVIK
jgi:hypothetical protein